MVYILWYNWKDFTNPAAGGAEVYTHEIARRLVGRGHEVTLFTSEFDGSKSEDVVDGVRIIRKGGKYGVYETAKKFYEHNQNKFDVVIDEINTRPFLTPKFVKNNKIIAVIHQLAREFWFSETPFPMALLGYYFLEKRWLRNYANVPTVTVSKSTQNDLQELGFSNTAIVPNGINVQQTPQLPEKELSPTIIYVGRMKKAKKPQDVIAAFKIVKKKIPNSKLWMVGDGYLSNHLEFDSCDIKFFGRVESNLRDDLIKKAWLIAVPGVREGWGQVVSDSNALGTPAVGYRIPGLVDSIKEGCNGLLVETNPESLANGIVNLLSDQTKLKTLGEKAMKWAKQFSWDDSAKEFETILCKS